MLHQLIALSSPRAVHAGRPGHNGRLALAIFGAVLALALGNLLVVLGTSTPWLLLAATPLYAAYVTAAILVALGIHARLRGQPLRPVPLLSRLWRPCTSYRVLTLLVVAITLLREGACSGLALQYNATSAESHTTSNSNASSTTWGERSESRLAGRPVYCTAYCDSSSSATCKAALEELCDQQPVGHNAVHVSIRLSVEDPFCYVPLVKSSDTQFHTTADLEYRALPGSTSIRLMLYGRVELTAIGPMSCHAYRRMLANHVREQVVKAVNSTLAEN